MRNRERKGEGGRGRGGGGGRYSPSLTAQTICETNGLQTVCVADQRYISPRCQYDRVMMKKAGHWSWPTRQDKLCLYEHPLSPNNNMSLPHQIKPLFFFSFLFSTIDAFL